MKKSIAILAVVFLFSLFIIPKHAMADGSGAAQAALIGAGIGLVIGVIIYAVSVSSEKPMDQQKPGKDTRQSSSSNNGLNTYADDFQTMSSKDKTSTVKVNLFPFSVSF
jgi:hypothetical protein